MNPVTQRPKSLCEIAERADSIEAWGLALGDLLDEIGFRRERSVVIASCLQAEPPLLRGKFAQGEVADAFAAALAEYLAAEHLRENAPTWTRGCVNDFSRRRGSPMIRRSCATICRRAHHRCFGTTGSLSMPFRSAAPESLRILPNYADVARAGLAGDHVR